MKNQFNMKVTVILIIIGALGTIPKSLVKGYKNWKLVDEKIPSKQQHC